MISQDNEPKKPASEADPVETKTKPQKGGGSVDPDALGKAETAQQLEQDARIRTAQIEKGGPDEKPEGGLNQDG